MKKVFILTGESSGELYGSLLARKLRERWSDIKILGVGGEMMKREGVELVSKITGAFGLMELISSLKQLKEKFDTVVRAVIRERPDVLVLIDFPDFNIKVAKAVKHSGVKILYYVSPQVWAWRKKRVHTIAALSDYVAVILPFEEEYYRETNVACEFVGHPVVDELQSVKGSECFIKEKLGIHSDTPLLALLPGSRDTEMKRLLPVFIRLVDLLRENYPAYQFIMPVALNIDRNRHSGYFESLTERGVHLVDGEAAKVLSCTDLAVIASGTAAFQAALMDVPLVVVYKLFPVTYWIAKIIIQVKYINLVNIMMGEEIIKELLQGRANPDTIFNELQKIIEDANVRNRMTGNFRKVRDLFEERHASERVSAIIGELAAWD